MVQIHAKTEICFEMSAFFYIPCHLSYNQYIDCMMSEDMRWRGRRLATAHMPKLRKMNLLALHRHGFPSLVSLTEVLSSSYRLLIRRCKRPGIISRSATQIRPNIVYFPLFYQARRQSPEWEGCTSAQESGTQNYWHNYINYKCLSYLIVILMLVVHQNCVSICCFTLLYSCCFVHQVITVNKYNLISWSFMLYLRMQNYQHIAHVISEVNQTQVRELLNLF